MMNTKESKEATKDNDGNGKFLSLMLGCWSKRSVAMIDDLADTIKDAAGRRYKPSVEFMTTLACLIADLLRIEHGGYDYGYHGFSPKDFIRSQVGYKPFKAVVKGLEAMDFIERKRGFKEHTGPKAKAQATRFEATDKLLAYALGYGIRPSNYRRHFHRLPRPEAIANPIQLRSARYFNRKGQRMPFDPQADLPAMAGRQVDEINAFLSRQHIYPDRHYGFHRIYADGDQPLFNWDKGARFYSIGLHNYQNLSKIRRLRMRLNYEAVVEIDVRACYLTILHAMRGVEFNVNIDPYTLAGIDREPVKAFVAMTLGYDKFHKGWSQTAKDDYEVDKKDKYEADGKTKKRYRSLEGDYPFEFVKKATIASLPVLADWPESLTTWSDLQYIESSAMGEALHTLNCIHGVPALPVHDSMIVPLSKRSLAEQVISDAFLKHAKVRPALSAKWLEEGCEVKEISKVHH